MAGFASKFGFSARQVEVQPGYVYRRSCRADWAEIARVRSINEDAVGIPHVTFDLSFECNRHPLNALPDRRTLNLRSFQEAFRELIRSEPRSLLDTR